MKYHTGDLIFQYTHEPLGECIYEEKSSHERDISQCANVTKVFLIETLLSLLHRSWISVDVSQITRCLHKVFPL